MHRWYHRCMAMTLRLDPDEDAALERAARAAGVSKIEFVRQAVRRAVSGSDHALLERMLAEHAETFERLGDA